MKKTLFLIILISFLYFSLRKEVQESWIQGRCNTNSENSSVCQDVCAWYAAEHSRTYVCRLSWRYYLNNFFETEINYFLERFLDLFGIYNN